MTIWSAAIMYIDNLVCEPWNKPTNLSTLLDLVINHKIKFYFQFLIKNKNLHANVLLWSAN